MSTTSQQGPVSVPAPRSRTKQRSNFELYSWLFMRISGIVLVFLFLVLIDRQDRRPAIG